MILLDKKNAYKKMEVSKIDSTDIEEVEHFAKFLCDKIQAFDLKDSENRSLRTWDSLKDGSSRAEYELTMWRKLAADLLDEFWK